jgi:hypothetical protein
MEGRVAWVGTCHRRALLFHQRLVLLVEGSVERELNPFDSVLPEMSQAVVEGARAIVSVDLTLGGWEAPQACRTVSPISTWPRRKTAARSLRAVANIDHFAWCAHSFPT